MHRAVDHFTDSGRRRSGQHARHLPGCRFADARRGGIRVLLRVPHRHRSQLRAVRQQIKTRRAAALKSHHGRREPVRELPQRGGISPRTEREDSHTLVRLLHHLSQTSARTDSERTITYEPIRRPEVASLLQIAASCAGSRPELIAEHIGNGGAGELKRVVTESVNEHLRPLRHRRHELAANPGYLLDVLRAGNARANEIAEHTLDEVRAVMGMKY